MHLVLTKGWRGLEHKVYATDWLVLTESKQAPTSGTGYDVLWKFPGVWEEA